MTQFTQKSISKVFSTASSTCFNDFISKRTEKTDPESGSNFCSAFLLVTHPSLRVKGYPLPHSL